MWKEKGNSGNSCLETEWASGQVVKLAGRMPGSSPGPVFSSCFLLTCTLEGRR